jgi:hypothetical protein
MVAPGSRALPHITASSPAAPASNALRNMPLHSCATECIPDLRVREVQEDAGCHMLDDDGRTPPISNQRRPACSLQGFRKVDPDQWEFVHMTFLREQTCLLVRILRRSHGGKCKDDGNTGNAATEDTVAMEVVQLRQEQRAIEEQVVAMWRRVQENQMLMFLAIISNL